MNAEPIAAADARMAAELGLPHRPDADILIEFVDGRLQARDTRPGGPGPLFVDFNTPDISRRVREGPRLPLARAVGLKRGEPCPAVVDATAGLGRDAWTLAALGCEVQALERSAVIAALLRDGLRRGPAEFAARVHVQVGDAVHLLPGLEADVVLLDPMFEPDGKSALPPKHARYLQALAPEDTAENAALFEAAYTAAGARVVVKRPHRGPPLVPSPKVNHSLTGKTIRFDVYVKGR
jgi:16S rRNA (guanine1516-N2)-methyltransferase